MMELKARQQAILDQIVKRYIASGEAVASRQVAQSPEVDLSPATVRNVMAELEGAGYLYRSHKSAGSVPSDLAFRAYVDHLALGRSLPASTKKKLVEEMSVLRRELAEDLGWVARLIADATQEAGVAARPMGDQGDLEVVSLAPLGDRRVLGVIVTSGGGVEKRVLVPDHELSYEELIRVANTLNHLFHGRRMDWIRCHPMVESSPKTNEGLIFFGHDDIDPVVWDFAHDLFSSKTDNAEVLVAGAENLAMKSDFSEVDRLRSLMVVLEDREAILREWRRLFDEPTTQVVIGEESEMTAMGHLGMVATLFYREGQRVGAVGVVGPRRMDYLRVVPVVEFVGRTLTQMLDEAI